MAIYAVLAKDGSIEKINLSYSSLEGETNQSFDAFPYTWSKILPEESRYL